MPHFVAEVLVLLSVGAAVGHVHCFPSLNILSAHLGNQIMTGYKVIQPSLNYSLEEISARFPSALDSYTYTALVDRSGASPCGPEGVEKSVTIMMDFYKSRMSRANGLTVFFAPSK
jgi:hypothetical protein